MKRILFISITLLCHTLLWAANGVYVITDFGAKGDGTTLNTLSIQNAIDACAKTGGKVIVPPGNYLTGALFFKSNVNLEIMTGAVLQGSENFDHYPPVEGRYGGIERSIHSSLITGHNLENISITGRGTLNGNGKVWWDAHQINSEMRKKAGITEREPENPPGSPLKWARPRMINLYNCKNVLIRDITMLDSPSWTVHPVYCENVTIENISIIQPYESPNTDGINPESCNNVRIFNCFVDCGDDCITIKSGYNEDGRRVNIPCENIVIANCTFKHGRSAIGIGSETSGGVRNVTISNCVFKDTYRGLRVKSARGRGNVVENIRASNIIMENVGTGISLDMFYGSKDEIALPVDETTPHFRNIRYSHITGTNIKKAGEIWGLPEAPMYGVVFSDVYLDAETGLETSFTDNLTLRDVEINVKKGPALTVKASTDLELDNVTSRKPLFAIPVMVLDRTDTALIRDCRAAKDTDIFMEISDSSTKNITLLNNHLKYSKIPIKFSNNANKTAVTQ